jgi:hypothetical protein
MTTALTAVVLFGCLVGIVMLGRYARRYLPEHHFSLDSKDAVKLAMSLVATMTALLPGLLISSAKRRLTNPLKNAAWKNNAQVDEFCGKG